MQYVWDSLKRRSNLSKHGFDFADANIVFEGPTFTYEDDRYDYGEQRWVTLGFLKGLLLRSPILRINLKFVLFPCVEELSMSNLSSSRISETDWERVSAMTDAEIELSDIPETTAEQMARSTFRINRVPVERKQESVQLMIDSFVLDYFKAKAGDRDYRSLVNTALAEYMMSHPLGL